ncbi:MAG TPA: DNA translocase FtsK [Anaerolineae bacterium]|nr:DNA translocase FtsK [Anaerolineae bacterium]
MSRKSGGAREQAKPSKGTRRKPEPRRRQLRFTFGARRQEIAGVLLIALAAVSLLALLQVTTGALIDGWSALLVRIFGVGAYVAAVAIGLAGVVMMRRAQGAPLQIQRLRLIGLEAAFFALLAALHAAAWWGEPWALIEQGTGGGLIGWGLSVLLVESIGPALTALFFGAIVLVGLTLGLPIDWGALFSWMRERLTAPAAPIAEPPTQPTASPPARSATAPPSLKSLPTVSAKPRPEPERPTTHAPLPAPRIIGAAPAPKPEQIELPLPQKKIADIQAELPALDLLQDHSMEGIAEQETAQQAHIIEETLRHFGLAGHIVDTLRGPAVTQFALEPGYIERPGLDGEPRRQKVRVGQITSLANDLALALAAPSLRIEAPVPGKSYIGIEVPNEKIALVSLRGVMDSPAFAREKLPLRIALGRNVSGQPIVTDLTAMPHLLIAGTTGSGKSVLISALTVCLTFSNTPADLRLVLIDPKMVELVRFNGLPHIYGKVETDTERIVGVLRWVTHEMDRRYKLFAELGVRNLKDYNLRMLKQNQPKLQVIVVMIDELADLMLSSPVEVEKTICRLAQMARATGIHLVVATQRPSTDVVTGLIKANFPARIAFAVASGVDSRVILDTVGAETLLGRGDMLFQSPESGRPVRVQGCYVSDREIESLVTFWSEQYQAVGPEPAPWDASMSQLLKVGSGKTGGGAGVVDEADEAQLLQTAIDLVRREGGASASLLQRKLRIGYPKAARLIDEMYEQGLIGPPVEAGRLREVLPRR